MSASQISFSDFALSQCPWCGTIGPDFDESPAPSDYCGHDLATVCTPPVIGTAVAVVAHPLAVDGGECARPLRKSWLVSVLFTRGARAGEVHSFRWFSVRGARRCARDFTTAVVSITECLGRITFSGWVAA